MCFGAGLAALFEDINFKFVRSSLQHEHEHQLIYSYKISLCRCNLIHPRWFQGFDFDSLANLTLIPPQISDPIEGPLDLINFDVYPNDTAEVADETSGWDEEF